VIADDSLNDRLPRHRQIKISVTTKDGGVILC